MNEKRMKANAWEIKAVFTVRSLWNLFVLIIIGKLFMNEKNSYKNYFKDLVLRKKSSKSN